MSKINLFEDKEYESFDWLNKAVEPFIFPASELLASIPNEHVFTFEQIRDIFIDSGFSSSNKDQIMHFVCKMNNIEISDQNFKLISDLFEIKVEPNTVINLGDNAMSGKVSLIKNKEHLEDEDIKELLASNVYSRYNRYASKGFDCKKINEIIAIIGANHLLKTKSVGKKLRGIAEEMKKIFLEDKWRIRDYDLAIRVVDWSIDYMINGNLASLSNFTRLKCMTHNGAPIYSMEETK